jgi:CRP-like cAMP-binding protein
MAQQLTLFLKHHVPAFKTWKIPALESACSLQIFGCDVAVSQQLCAHCSCADFVSKVSIKSYRTGEAIFKQGDIMDSVYIVTKGSVRQAVVPQ